MSLEITKFIDLLNVYLNGVLLDDSGYIDPTTNSGTVTLVEPL